MKPIRSLGTAILTLLAGAALTACSVGPNFEVPASTTPAVFERVSTQQAPSQPVEAAFQADWWTLFDDPVLNTLEQRLADANLDVAGARPGYGKAGPSGAWPARPGCPRSAPPAPMTANAAAKTASSRCSA